MNMISPDRRFGLHRNDTLNGGTILATEHATGETIGSVYCTRSPEDDEPNAWMARLYWNDKTRHIDYDPHATMPEALDELVQRLRRRLDTRPYWSHNVEVTGYA